MIKIIDMIITTNRSLTIKKRKIVNSIFQNSLVHLSKMFNYTI